jgi:hypothetical protein
VDHLLRKSPGGQLSPLGHLGGSSLEYGWEIWNVARRPNEPAPEAPAKPEVHAAGPEVSTPAVQPNMQDVVDDQADTAVRGPSKKRRRKAK